MSRVSDSSTDRTVLRRILARILFRSRVDVAVAQAAVAMTARAAKWVPVQKPHSSLTLILDREELVWTAAPSNHGQWNDFLKWYHGRPQSPALVMTHKDGSTMVRRKDIKRYEIRYWEA